MKYLFLGREIKKKFYNLLCAQEVMKLQSFVFCVEYNGSFPEKTFLSALTQNKLIDIFQQQDCPG